MRREYPHDVHPDTFHLLPVPLVRGMLESVRARDRERAFLTAQPTFAALAAHFNSQGGKRKPKLPEGTEPEPPLKDYEVFTWQELMRAYARWTLPGELQSGEPGVTPELAREVLRACRKGWVPSWVASELDFNALEAIAA